MLRTTGTPIAALFIFLVPVAAAHAQQLPVQHAHLTYTVPMVSEGDPSVTFDSVLRGDGSVSAGVLQFTCEVGVVAAKTIPLASIHFTTVRCEIWDETTGTLALANSSPMTPGVVAATTALDANVDQTHTFRLCVNAWYDNNVQRSMKTRTVCERLLE